MARLNQSRAERQQRIADSHANNARWALSQKHRIPPIHASFCFFIVPVAAGLLAAPPAAAQAVAPASPSIAEMQARRANPAALAAALKQRDAVMARQAATIARLNQSKAELQQRLSTSQARLAQIHRTR